MSALLIVRLGGTCRAGAALRSYDKTFTTKHCIYPIKLDLSFSDVFDLLCPWS